MCRTGCPTQDHESWGACARDAHVAVQWLGGTGPSARDVRRWHSENERYASAVRQGLQPDAPTHSAVDAALKAAGD